MENYSEAGLQPESGNGHSFLFGLICGAALGALAGLLLAPKPGAELRNDVSDSARRLRRKAGEMYDKGSDVVGDVAAKSRRAFEAGREALQSARPSDARTTSSIDAPVS
jgi:gas vesicle protein